MKFMVRGVKVVVCRTLQVNRSAFNRQLKLSKVCLHVAVFCLTSIILLSIIEKASHILFELKLEKTVNFKILHYCITVYN